MNIIICDDHPIVRKGLRNIIEEEIAEAEVLEIGNSDALFSHLKNNITDLIVLDISMPGTNGFDALQKIKYTWPETKVLMISALSEEFYAHKTIKHGASGFLNKESAPEELIKAVKKIISGQIYISNSFAEKLAMKISGDYQNPPHEKLSSREFQIFLKIGEGHQVGEIANMLNLSSKTVSTHRARILEKTNFSGNIDIIKYCMQEKLV